MKYRNAVMEIYGGVCVECGTNIDPQCHHKLPNTKPNRKNFPLFIESPMNFTVLCGGFSGSNCHENKKHCYKIREREAELYERYLHSLNENKEFFDANTELNHKLIRENDNLKREIEELKAYYKGLLEGTELKAYHKGLSEGKKEPKW